MEAYLFSTLILIFLALISERISVLTNKRYFFITLSCIYLILFSGLRDVSVGDDTIAYMLKYDAISDITWKELWDMLYYHYIGTNEIKAPGYFLFQKVAKVFFPSYQLYLLFIAFIFTYQLSRFICRESSFPLVSFIIYLCLFFEFFGVTGHRQTVATAITILFGYHYIKERRFFPFLLLILIASTLHKTVFILVPFYFIARFKKTRSYTPLILALFIIMFILKGLMFQILAMVGGYEQYSELESRGAYTFSVFYVAVVCIYFWFYPRILKNRPTADITLNALWFGLIFVPLIFVNPFVMRIVQYFSLFIILAIPDLIKCLNNESKPLAYFSCIILLTFLLYQKKYHYILMQI